jgi:hypothetical protein
MIEDAVPEPANELFQVHLEVREVDKVAVAVEITALKADLNPVVVSMLFVFDSPIAAHQIMPGGEILGDPQGIHPLLLSIFCL